MLRFVSFAEIRFKRCCPVCCSVCGSKRKDGRRASYYEGLSWAFYLLYKSEHRTRGTHCQGWFLQSNKDKMVTFNFRFSHSGVGLFWVRCSLGRARGSPLVGAKPVCKTWTSAFNRKNTHYFLSQIDTFFVTVCFCVQSMYLFDQHCWVGKRNINIPSLLSA